MNRKKNYGERGLEELGENAVKVFDIFHEYLVEHGIKVPTKKRMANKIMMTVWGKRFTKNNFKGWRV